MNAQVRTYPENLKNAEREIWASSSAVLEDAKIRRRLGNAITEVVIYGLKVFDRFVVREVGLRGDEEDVNDEKWQTGTREHGWLAWFVQVKTNPDCKSHRGGR